MNNATRLVESRTKTGKTVKKYKETHNFSTAVENYVENRLLGVENSKILFDIVDVRNNIGVFQNSVFNESVRGDNG